MLINCQDERALPAIDKVQMIILVWQIRVRKQRVLSPSTIVIFLYICLYRFISLGNWAPFEHQSAKNQCVFKCPKRQKVSIYKGFSRHNVFFADKKTNTIFYIVLFT